MLCPYLRGQSTFGGSLFIRWALLLRFINIWCQIFKKCLFRGLASMEVGWPQLLWDLIHWQKSTSHAKFDHYRTSGSWVMSSSVQKTSNAHSPLIKFHLPPPHHTNIQFLPKSNYYDASTTFRHFSLP